MSSQPIKTLLLSTPTYLLPTSYFPPAYLGASPTYLLPRHLLSLHPFLSTVYLSPTEVHIHTHIHTISWVWSDLLERSLICIIFSSIKRVILQSIISSVFLFDDEYY